MRIDLILSDDDYRRILGSKCRVRGSICQVSPTEFSFRAFAHSEPSEPAPSRKFRTRHSLTTVTPDVVKLTFRILRKEPTDPTEAMYDEVDDAASFVESNLG